MKNLITAGMTLPQGALSIAQALADMGGTDKDFTSLIGNKQLCGEIAKIILDRHFVAVGFPLPDVYPGWVKRKLYPDLAHLYSLTEFDVRTLEWKYPVYVQGRIVTGDIKYQFIVNRGIINKCLGLPELKAIQKKGPGLFKEYFDGLIVMGWRSVVEHNNGALCVPGLSLENGNLILNWYRLDEEFGTNRPVISFKDQ